MKVKRLPRMLGEATAWRRVARRFAVNSEQWGGLCYYASMLLLSHSITARTPNPE